MLNEQNNPTPRISIAPLAPKQPRAATQASPRAHATRHTPPSSHPRAESADLAMGDFARGSVSGNVTRPRAAGLSSRTASLARASDPLRGMGPILRRGDGRPAVALTGPTIDGGTRVELATSGPVGRVGELVRRLHAGGKAGELVELPLVDGRAAWASVLSTRAKGGGVALLVADVVHVTIGPRWTRLEFKAGGLWRDGWASLAGLWIASASAWSGSTCTLETSHAAGWRVTALEICRDLQGLGAWSLDDGRHAAWVGWRGATITAHSQKAGESVSVGSRHGSNVSLCCYGKTGQLAARGGDGALAMYAAAWSRSPAYQASREVQRVEFRLRKRGLDLTCMRTGEVAMLRDPAALASAETLGRLWAYLAARYRLVVASERGKSHKAIPSDPRWLVVASVTESTDGASRDFAQAREASRATLAEQQQRSRRRLLEALARDAGLHGARPASRDAALAWTGFRLSTSHASEIAKMAERAESITRTRSGADGWALDCAADEAREQIGAVPGLGWTAGTGRQDARHERPMFGPGPWVPRFSPPGLALVSSPSAALVASIGGGL